MDERFEGRRVLVIACGWPPDKEDDLGRATALAFAAAGAEVVLARPHELRSRDPEIPSRLTFHHFDPLRPETFQTLAREIARVWDSLDVLVTHFMAAHVGGLAETSLEQWEQTLRVNLTGVFAASKAFLTLLRQGREPAIVHVSSIDGRLGNPNILGYSASKGGVNALVHALSGALASDGIRVNAVERAASSGIPMDGHITASLTSATPLGRAGMIEEYAAAILFLASSAASYITGATLPVDGGRTGVTPGTAPGYRGYG